MSSYKKNVDQKWSEILGRWQTRFQNYVSLKQRTRHLQNLQKTSTLGTRNTESKMRKKEKQNQVHLLPEILDTAIQLIDIKALQSPV